MIHSAIKNPKVTKINKITQASTVKDIQENNIQ